jgi:ABC-type arginine/histidine transport system permease subunit
MDFSWLIWFLVVVVILSVGFAIIKYLIMPVVPAPAQAVVWAIIGICLLIGLLVVVSGSGYWHSHGLPR